MKEKIIKVLAPFFMVAIFLTVMALMGSHLSFSTRVSGVLTATAAHELGLLDESDAVDAVGPTRVWFAKAENEQFEFRSAWPIIGSVPFDFFGSGKTSKDLFAECDRLGEKACKRIRDADKGNSNN